MHFSPLKLAPTCLLLFFVFSTSFLFVCVAPQEAGVQLGDTLEQLDGVHLGSFQEAIERLKQRRGTVVLTLLRQKA